MITESESKLQASEPAEIPERKKLAANVVSAF
jgi:hypothetical protein